jgi:hypothetical protein
VKNQEAGSDFFTHRLRLVVDTRKHEVLANLLKFLLYHVLRIPFEYDLEEHGTLLPDPRTFALIKLHAKYFDNPLNS